MRLSLARMPHLNDIRKSYTSQGFWLVREIPGFCLVKVHDRWNISCISWLEQDTLWKQATAKAWGENYKARSELYSSLRGILARRTGSTKETGFATRREALFALEAELAKKPDSQLKELL